MTAEGSRKLKLDFYSLWTIRSLLRFFLASRQMKQGFSSSRCDTKLLKLTNNIQSFLPKKCMRPTPNPSPVNGKTVYAIVLNDITITIRIIDAITDNMPEITSMSFVCVRSIFLNLNKITPLAQMVTSIKDNGNTPKLELNKPITIRQIQELKPVNSEYALRGVRITFPLIIR
jgi:hypothetical protein